MIAAEMQRDEAAVEVVAAADRVADVEVDRLAPVEILDRIGARRGLRNEPLPLRRRSAGYAACAETSLQTCRRLTPPVYALKHSAANGGPCMEFGIFDHVDAQRRAAAGILRQPPQDRRSLRPRRLLLLSRRRAPRDAARARRLAGRLSRRASRSAPSGSGSARWSTRCRSIIRCGSPKKSACSTR